MTDISAKDPVAFAIYVSLPFCAGGAGIDVRLYVAVLEFPLVTRKMFAHTGDTRVVCAFIKLDRDIWHGVCKVRPV